MKYHSFTVRLTPSQKYALDEAMRRQRVRTGKNVAVADMVRRGLEMVCEGEGVVVKKEEPS